MTPSNDRKYPNRPKNARNREDGKPSVPKSSGKRAFGKAATLAEATLLEAGGGEPDSEKFATACATPLPATADASPSPPPRVPASCPTPSDLPPGSPEGVRCFLALDISPEVRANLADLLSRLKKGAVFTGARPSWVPPENIHLTLHFLGVLAPETIEAMKPHLDRVAAQFSAPRLNVRMLGCFPNDKMPKVLWIGISKPDRSLFNLRESLLPIIARAGVRLDPKPFHPHLTLARIRSIRGLHGLVEVIASHRRFEAGTCSPGELILFKSELRRESAVYTPLHRSPLSPPPEVAK